MEYWDNAIDRAIDEEIDRLIWEEKANKAQENVNISDPIKLLGAQ